MQRQLVQRLLTPTTVDRHADGLQRPGRTSSHDARIGQRARTSIAATSRTRSTPAATSTCTLTQRVVPERARRLLPRQLHGHRHSETPRTTPTRTSTRRLHAGVPANLQGADGLARTRRARRSPTSTRPSASIFNVDYNHAFNAGRLPHAQGRLRLPARRSTTSTRSIRAATSTSTGAATVRVQRRRPAAPAPTATTRSTIAAARQGRRQHPLAVRAGQWTVGNRLTLNLGLRTENEKVPTFRPDIRRTHSSSASATSSRRGSAPPTTSAATARLKVFGSWGRYYDWTKYELPRGSFGGDTGSIYYRGLDTLDLGSLNLSQHAGRDLWVRSPGSCPRPPRADLRLAPTRTSSRCTRTAPASASSTSSDRNMRARRCTTSTTTCSQTIEDIGALDASGNEVLRHRQPRRGHRRDPVAVRRDAAGSPMPQAEAPVRRAGARLQPPLLEQLVLQRELHAEPAVRQLRGSRGVRRDHARRRPASRPATAQQQAGSIARPGGNANRAWDIDELLWDSHGNLDVLGRLADRSPARGQAVRRVHDCRSARRSARSSTAAAARRSRTYVVDRRNQIDRVRRRPRRHGPHAGAHPHRPAAVARARSLARHQAAAARAERPERLQPEDGARTSSTT